MAAPAPAAVDDDFVSDFDEDEDVFEPDSPPLRLDSSSDEESDNAYVAHDRATRLPIPDWEARVVQVARDLLPADASQAAMRAAFERAFTTLATIGVAAADHAFVLAMSAAFFVARESAKRGPEPDVVAGHAALASLVELAPHATEANIRWAMRRFSAAEFDAIREQPVDGYAVGFMRQAEDEFRRRAQRVATRPLYPLEAWEEAGARGMRREWDIAYVHETFDSLREDAEEMFKRHAGVPPSVRLDMAAALAGLRQLRTIKHANVAWGMWDLARFASDHDASLPWLLQRVTDRELALLQSTGIGHPLNDAVRRGVRVEHARRVRITESHEQRRDLARSGLLDRVNMHGGKDVANLIGQFATAAITPARPLRLPEREVAHTLRLMPVAWYSAEQLAINAINQPDAPANRTERALLFERAFLAHHAPLTTDLEQRRMRLSALVAVDLVPVVDKFARLCAVDTLVSRSREADTDYILTRAARAWGDDFFRREIMPHRQMTAARRRMEEQRADARERDRMAIEQARLHHVLPNVLVQHVADLATTNPHTRERERSQRFFMTAHERARDAAALAAYAASHDASLAPRRPVSKRAIESASSESVKKARDDDEETK